MNKITQILVDHNKITTLTLKGENNLNILNYQTIVKLKQVLTELDNDKSIEALIITGHGSKAFCSGADISELSNMDESLIEEYVETGMQTFLQIENFHAPVIAAINGYAFGAAFELLLSCDIRIISSSAIIGQPAVRHGLIPPFGGLHRLPKIVGLGNAKYIIFSAEHLNAEEALRIGLVNKIYDSDILFEEVNKIAKQIIKGKKYSLALSKNILNSSKYQDTIDLEKNALIDCLKNSETKSQLDSFFEQNKLKNKKPL